MGWHKPVNFKHVKIEPTIMGCGHMQIRGLSIISHHSDAEFDIFSTEFLTTLKSIGNKKATSGGDDRPCKTFLYVEGHRSLLNDRYKQRLELLGFKELVRYPNAAHPGHDDIQALMILVLE